jgi:DNA repair exonuclease SbcCD ATPase subunit
MSSEYDDLIMLAERRELESALSKAVSERDEALAQVARREREHEALLETAQKALEQVEAERDEARAQRDNLLDASKEGAWMARALDAERERDDLRAQLAFLRDEYGVNADNGTLTRDALEQKIQVLIDERRQLRARLVECRAWAGRCPYPDTPAFDELISVRELADDTLEEVKP